MKSTVGAAALAVVVLSACATAPPLDFTVENPQVAVEPLNARLQGVSVELDPATSRKSVQADDSIFPLWQAALAAASSDAKIFSEKADQQVKLSVKVSKVDAPEFGATMTTRSVAQYEIVDVATGDVLRTQMVDAKGITPADFAFAGYVRALDSINRSVRNNIAEFIASFSAGSATVASLGNSESVR